MQPFRTRTRLAVLGTAAAVGIGLFAGLGPGRWRVEPPRGTADRRRPADRQHRPVRVRQPGQAETTVTSSATGSRSRSRPAARTSTRSAEDVRYDVNIDNDGDAKPD